MIGLDAVVKDRDNHAFAGIAFGPGRDDVHVEPFLTPAVLRCKTKFNWNFSFVFQII